MLGTITDASSLSTAFQTAIFGDRLLLIALILSAFLFVLTGVGMLRKDERLIHAARRGQYALYGLLALAAATLLLMIFDGMFVSSYVNLVTELREEFLYKITGLWASQAGSLLFWCFTLTFCGAIFAFANRHTRTDRRLASTMLVLFAVQTFFLALMMYDASSPFTLQIEEFLGDELADKLIANYSGWLSQNVAFSADYAHLTFRDVYHLLINNPSALPQGMLDNAVAHFHDGAGLNPRLHNYWIVIHPPTLYLGYIGFTIPFCYAVGSLISGELDAEWIRRARVWTMFSWIFLSAGIAMGGLWAYEILGWGGYWAWDPVENVSLIPWLTATAFFHSVIVQERRGLLQTWNVVLIILTYTFTVIGTFLVRSGIVESVHAFGDTDLKWPLVIFIIVVMLIPLLLVVYRYPLLKGRRKLESMLSREAVFVLNNLLLVLLAVVVLFMTLYPPLSEFLFGDEQRFQFGEEAYVMVGVPLFLLLLLLTAVGPLLAYGRTSPRRLVRQLAWPVGFAFVAGVVNLVILYSRDALIGVSGDSFHLSAAALARLMAQITMIPIVTMITVGVWQELWQSAKIRRRRVSATQLGALASSVLANRRRFGGYISHFGFALIALGIYFSSYYDVDTSAQLKEGDYTLLAGRWAVVHDGVNISPLYDKLPRANRRNGQEGAAARVGIALAKLRAEPEVSVEELIKRRHAEIRTQIKQMGSKHGTSGEPSEERITEYLNIVTQDFKTADAMIKSDRAYESYETTIRLFPYTPRAITPKAKKEFDRLYREVLEEKERGDLKAFKELVGLALTIGPVVQTLLQEYEATATGNIDSVRNFHETIIRNMHHKEREMAVTLCDKSAAGDTEAESRLRDLQWRALGGLRQVEKEGSEKAKAVARRHLATLLADATTIRPRIKLHYDKTTGTTGPEKSVSDPAIYSHLTQDVYFILQGVQSAEGGDTAVYRIFVKPGMNFGLAGLVIIIFGATFALLPRRRRIAAEEIEVKV